MTLLRFAEVGKVVLELWIVPIARLRYQFSQIMIHHKITGILLVAMRLPQAQLTRDMAL